MLRNGFFIFLLFTAFLAKSQSSENDFSTQYWLDLVPKWNLKGQSDLKLDLGYRTISPQTWQRFILRGQYEYYSYDLLFKSANTKERLIGGLGLFYLDAFEGSNSLEIRPMQGYQLDLEINSYLSIYQLLRFEERFEMKFDSNQDNDFGFRIRYKAQMDYEIGDLVFQKGTGFYIPFYVEVFLNIVSIKQFNDVLRISPGIGYQFNSDFKIQLTAAYQYTYEEFKELTRTNNVVFRLAVYKTIF